MKFIGYPEEKWEKIRINSEKTNYSVSTYGNVRNDKKNKHIKLHIQNNGYYGFTISHKGKPHSFKIASLVAKTFIPNDNPDIKTQVDHIDGTPEGKRNNSIYNLEWVTPEENQRRSIQNGLFKTSCPITSTDTVIKICEMLEKDKSISDISKELDVSKKVIRSILNRERFTNISKKYDFSKRHKSKSGVKPTYNDNTINIVCKLYIKEFKVSDISKIMNIPENTVFGIVTNRYKAYSSIVEKYDFSKRIKPKKSKSVWKIL